MDQDQANTLARKLDVIIALLLDASGGEDAVQTSSKVLKLYGLGIPTSEIAGIVNKKSNYVSAVISSANKKGKKK